MKRITLLTFLILLSGVSARGQTTAQANLTASAASAACNVVQTSTGIYSSSSCLMVQIKGTDSGATLSLGAGTYAGTTQFEASSDAGAPSNWVPFGVTPSSGGSQVTSTSPSGTNQAAAWQGNVSGYNWVRVRLSTYSSGTFPVTIQTAPGAEASNAGGGGSGNVVGPASSTTNDGACYADTTGKLLSDCGGAPITTAGPTSPNGVPQSLTNTPSGGMAGPWIPLLPGVPVNNNGETTCAPQTLNVLDRATQIFCSGTTTSTFTLPVHTTPGLGANFVFGLTNNNSGNMTITPTTDTIDRGTLLPNWYAALFNNAAGNWQSNQFPTYAAFPSCSGATNAISFSTSTGFGCNTINGGVTGVSNSDGTLTISPTTGAVVASIALGNANTWSGQQTFVAPVLGAATATSLAVGTSPPTCAAGTSGGQCYGEGTAPTGASSVDDIYADSTGHCISVINNNVAKGCAVAEPVGLTTVQTVTGADYTNATTTPSNVFSWTLPATAAAKNYAYTCSVMWESTAATLTGPQFAVNISAAPTQLTAATSVQNTLAGADINGYISNTTTGSQNVGTGTAAGVTSTNYWARIWGTIEASPTAGATFSITAAALSNTTSTVNIRRGSSCKLEVVQ